MVNKEPRTILIIDDDKCTVEIVSMILKNAGYRVNFETDGKLEFLKQLNIPDLILLDNWLGEEDGAVICAKLKATKEVAAVPIIMISATLDIESIAQRAGASTFLPKPFSMQELLKLTDSYLKTS